MRSFWRGSVQSACPQGPPNHAPSLLRERDRDSGDTGSNTQANNGAGVSQIVAHLKAPQGIAIPVEIVIRQKIG